MSVWELLEPDVQGGPLSWLQVDVSWKSGAQLGLSSRGIYGALHETGASQGKEAEFQWRSSLSKFSMRKEAKAASPL